MKAARKQRKRTIDARNTVSKNTKCLKAKGFVAEDARKSWMMTGKAGITLDGKAESPFQSPVVQELQPEIQVVGTDLQKMAPELLQLEARATLNPFVKFKLQLFPIDEETRKVLEQEGHNPHLELTLRARKKISSVLKHLNNKWGNSSVASGELMLFPYNIQQAKPTSYRGWTTKDIDTSAADVHAEIGRPSIFRLRYGWLPYVDKVSDEPSASLKSVNCSQSKATTVGWTAVEIVHGEKKPCEENRLQLVTDPSNAIMGQLIPLEQEVEAMDISVKCPETELSNGVWPDNLTNISWDLLKEASQVVDSKRCNQVPSENDLCLQQTQFSCESFDADIAGLLARHQGSNCLTTASDSSIWDAEETCHAFPFQKTTSSSAGVPESSETAASRASNGNMDTQPQKHACEEATLDLQRQTQGLHNVATATGLTDICWFQADSLGTLDLAISSSRQIISGDSISLSGLLASSLDAFQNCCFFGQ